VQTPNTPHCVSLTLSLSCSPTHSYVKLSEHNLALRDKQSTSTLSRQTSLQIMRETLTEANGRANGQVDPAQLQTVEISDASRSSKDSGSVKPGLHFKQFRQYTTGAGGSTATTAFCGVLRHTSSDRHISYSPSGECYCLCVC
jgi:hypothetical protein